MGTVYITEDGKQVMEGDLVYNYYDMLPGRIGRDSGLGWFDFHQEGGTTQLNGQRICSMEFAQARGWVRKDTML
jgi:hypothetical protein